MVQRSPFFLSLRFLAPVILAFTLALSLSGITSGISLAAPLHQQTAQAAPQIPNSTIIYWNACGASDCYGNVGVNYGFNARWNSGPCCFLGFTAYWGDGGSDTWQCFFGCGSGSQNEAHFWNRSGTFNTYACADACSNTVRMHIS